MMWRAWQKKMGDAAVLHARLWRPLLAVASGVAMASAQAADLPTGGQITAGTGSISQSGNTLTVTQTSSKLAADWQSFSIGQGNVVDFVQPSSSSVALNRVIGSDVSVIQGSLHANGQVFLINPNGVLFTPTAQVNTGGLVASTLALSNANFLAGNYTFVGDSSNAVINQGNIQMLPGSTVALIGAQVINTGTITAPSGNVLMGAGSDVTLDLGGPVKLQINKGALNALVSQGGAIIADGGHVYLTAKGADSVTGSVINHTGITEARTISTGQKGEIVLQGDMNGGTLNVGGTLDASAPTGGDGGSIETSAAYVTLAPNLIVNAGAALGKAGLWLIDPYNYTIDVTAASNIVTALNNGTDVTVDTSGDVANFGSGGDSSQIGDITVNSAIAKTAGGDATLTLQAADTIAINAPISSTVGRLNVALNADSDQDGNGAIILNSSITSNGGNITFGTGALISLNGMQTEVGGDVYVGGDGSGAVSLITNGGSVTIHGQTLIANTDGFAINTAGGNVAFDGMIDSGDTYLYVFSGGGFNWSQAMALAQGSTGGGAATGDTYLATITSRLENAVVSQVDGYDNAFLGGHRVTGIGTNAVWRWVTGPEGLMDGGKGLPFFTQNGDDTTNGSGGTPINNAYTNWDTIWGHSEPNNSNGANLSQEGESVLQFATSIGNLWNDVSPTINANSYMQETNLAPSPLTINAGAGAVTFGGAVGSNKALSSLTVTAGTINLNTGSITTSGAQTYNGNVALGTNSTQLNLTGADANFTLQGSHSITNASGANASLTVKTTGDILLDSGSSISSTGHTLDTTLWSDSDATGGGYIWLKGSGASGATITSGGGFITLSGGSDITTGYATGDTTTNGNGILLDNATLQSGGGNIILRGKSAATATTVVTSQTSSDNTDGIRLTGSDVIDSGTGTIRLTGVAVGTSGSSNGIETNIGGYSRILSAATNTTAISLSGDATGGTATDGWGTFLWGGSNFGVVIVATGTGGGISLNGLGRNTANGGGTHIEPNAFVLAASGPISITGTKGASSTYQDVVINGTVGYASTLPGGFGISSPVTASSSNITILADSLSADTVLGDGTFTGSTVQSSGILTLAPRTTGKALSIQTGNPGGSIAWIDDTHLFGSGGLFKTGFSKVVFGSSTTGTVTLDNYSFDNNTEIDTGSNAVLGNITIANHLLDVNITGSGSITDSGTLAVSKLALIGTSATALLDSAGNVIGTLAANLAALDITTGSALDIGSAGGINGITATGAISLATLTGNLTVDQAIATSSTASNALVLNAGKSSAIGTITGGDIVLNQTVTTGAGGRTTLYTGSKAGSPTAAAAAGTANQRYGADETTVSYSPALGSGIFAIFRELPAAPAPTTDTTGKTPSNATYAAISATQSATVTPYDDQPPAVVEPLEMPEIAVLADAENIGDLTVVQLRSDTNGPDTGPSRAFAMARDADDNGSGQMQLFVVDSGILLPGRRKDWD